MIFIDTSFFLALLDVRDSLNPCARSWANSLKEKLVVTEYVLWETINAASSPLKRPSVHALIDYVRRHPTYEVIPASADLFEAGLRLHADRPDKAWSLTDCISFVIMEQRGIRQALTFDHHFEQAGFEALLRRDPQA